MTTSSRFELSWHAQKLLAVLENSNGAWLTRKEIAHALGKNRLTTSAIHTLEKMALAGLVEMQRRANETPIGYETIYRFAAGQK